MRNRSLPTDTVLPHVTYTDIARAITWLTETLGFREHYRYGEPNGPVAGAQMHLDNAWIMLESARPGRATPKDLGARTQYLTVIVPDLDEHFRRTSAAGATIVEELHETIYGERQYGVEDHEGHTWLFSQHARDLSPNEWGAIVKSPANC